MLGPVGLQMLGYNLDRMKNSEQLGGVERGKAADPGNERTTNEPQ
jgi:hypothetical protein